MTLYLQLAYLLSAALFILGIKSMGNVETARRGMNLAALGMLVAIAGTLMHKDIVSYKWIIAALLVGGTIGTLMSLWIPMTAVPQRTALSHAGGALAATLIGVTEYYRYGIDLGSLKLGMVGVEILIGGLTVTGSLMAAAKLQELLPGHPITFKGQNYFNLALISIMVGLIVVLVFVPLMGSVFYLLLALALIFGLLLVLPIGAADMPVIIALLNSYAGLTDAAMGFMLDNRIQIITGALDGASGFILAVIMCKAMNRSINNVLFGAFGSSKAPIAMPAHAHAAAHGAAAAQTGPVIKKLTPEQAGGLFKNKAKSVIIVPGYGMAAAQAQHAVRELADQLKALGISVKYAIHPVAGRMPGHMNVLLAEANVPYTDLFDMEDINEEFEHTDVAIVIGANDVTNPAARTNTASPIYGMPILNVDCAKNVIVCKRSMSPGFAGIDNELYLMPQTYMLFGDAKTSIGKLVDAIKSGNVEDVPETAPAAASPTDGAPAVKQLSPEQAADLFQKKAKRVIIVPGYGMAAAQAQHAVRDLGDMLKSSGVNVKYAIHPVAGRMPGHMNVLLAEANVPYTDLFDMEDINDEFVETDVVLVVGANDVTNPAARTNPASPIYGMPILNVDCAKNVIVCKRSMKPGFAGIDNDLYLMPQTYMYFGDAKTSIGKLVDAMKAAK